MHRATSFVCLLVLLGALLTHAIIYDENGFPVTFPLYRDLNYAKPPLDTQCTDCQIGDLSTLSGNWNDQISSLIVPAPVSGWRFITMFETPITAVSFVPSRPRPPGARPHLYPT